MDLPKVTCYKCGKSWIPRTDAPKACPFCSSRKWNDKKYYEEKKARKNIIPMFSFIFLILASSAFAVDLQDLDLNVSLSEDSIRICYYNGTGSPFSCTDITGFNLSNNQSYIESISVPSNNQSLSCDWLDDGIDISCQPPDVVVNPGNMSCSPTLNCPAPPNLSCEPSLSCPEQSDAALTDCLASLDKKLNPPVEREDEVEGNLGLYLIIGGIILLGVILYRKYSPKNPEKDDGGVPPPEMRSEVRSAQPEPVRPSQVPVTQMPEQTHPMISSANYNPSNLNPDSLQPTSQQPAPPQEPQTPPQETEDEKRKKEIEEIARKIREANK